MSIIIILCHLHQLLEPIRCLGCFVVNIHEYLSKSWFSVEKVVDKNALLLPFSDLEKESRNLLCINHEDLNLMGFIASYPLFH